MVIALRNLCFGMIQMSELVKVFLVLLVLVISALTMLIFSLLPLLPVVYKGTRPTTVSVFYSTYNKAVAGKFRA